MGATQQALVSYGGFVGPLDALIAQGASLLYAGSVRRLLSSWTGNAMRLQGNGVGTPIASIPFLANGDLDLVAAAAAAAAGGGTAAAGETLYDQSGNVDATQTVIANQMPFSTSIEVKGAFGDGVAVVSRFMNLNLGTITFPTFVQTAVRYVSGASRALFNPTTSTSGCLMNSGAMRQNWGTLLAGTPGEVPNGPHTLGFLANGANSQNFVDGSLILTGDSGSTTTDWSAAKLGGTTTQAWLFTSGNSLSEIIIFSGDPTSLPSWNAFVANQKTYFGVP